MFFAEGGQSSTGSVLDWMRGLVAHGVAHDPTERGGRARVAHEALSYKQLDALAAGVPAGAGGLLVLETFQGARTPDTDPHARGAIIGLTLAHGRAELWRAVLEGVALGTRRALGGLARLTATGECSVIKVCPYF